MKIIRCIKSDAQFATAFAAIFSVAIAIGLWRHEMWRDEYHAWGLVLHSNSFLQMLGNLRGEGHLPLSYTLFFFLSRFTANPHAVQFAQFFLSIISAYLLLRYAPFKRWQKVLFLFGYFPLYEYGVISRSYTLDMLGLFGFCAVYGWAKKQNRKPWLAWFFILMLATNESFGILMALPLAGLLVADMCGQRKKSTWFWTGGILATCAALLIYFLKDVTTVGQWKGLFRHTPYSITDGFLTIFKVIGRAVLPKIHLPLTIWNLSFPPGILKWILLIIAVIVVCIFFCRLLLASLRLPFTLWNRRAAFIVWASGTTLLFLFLWISGSHIDDARHTGHFYLFFIACWWLSASFPKRDSCHSRWIEHVKKHAKSDFRFLLLAQLAFGLFAYSLDIIYPFSANQATALYLQNHSLQHAALVAPESIAIAAGRSAYFPQYDIAASYLLMRDMRLSTYLSKPTKEQLMQRTWRYVIQKQRDENVVVITDSPTTNATLQKYFQWQSFPTIVDNEQYYVYVIPRDTFAIRKN